MENENNQKPISIKDKKTQKKIGVVKTYAEDMAKVIETNEGSIIKKIIEEQEEHEAIKKNLSPESSRNKLFMLMGFTLIASAVALLVFLGLLKNQISSVEVKAQFKPIIFTDKVEYEEIGGFPKDKIIQTIFNETKATKIKSGEIESIYLTENKQIVGLRRFIALLKANFIPGETVFINDNFLLGIFNDGKNSGLKGDKSTQKDLFILIKGRSFLDMFPVLKSWENKMFSDLHGFFGVDINADTNYLLAKDFEDGIANNKNARILRDKDGKVVLEYIFADDNSVIITNSDEATKEVMLRLISMQIKK